MMNDQRTRWYSIFFSLYFLFRHLRILGWSLLLVVLTCLLTWIGYLEATALIDALVGGFFQHPPEQTGITGWLAVKGWLVLRYVFLFFSRVIAFYLAFLAAYCLTTPGYVFLSGATEKVFRRRGNDPGERFTIKTALTDLWEGIKIGAVGIMVTAVALIVNFLPLIGQVSAFLLYVFYSALMFVDYPASNRHWSLGRKIGWVKNHYGHSFRLGIFPALISMIPLVNIFLMALLFPLLTVHSTLNFLSVEDKEW